MCMRHFNPAGRNLAPVNSIHLRSTGAATTRQYLGLTGSMAPTPLEFDRMGISAVTVMLLPSVHGDASVGALRTAEGSRLHGHKDLIGELVNRNAVGIGARGHVDEPRARSGINHAHHRPAGHVPTGCIVAVVAGVVPDFVRAATLINAGDNFVCGTVKDDQ